MGLIQGKPQDFDPNDHINDTVLELNPGLYPNYGNYNDVFGDVNILAGKSIEEQMKYSDSICRRYAKNPIFLKQQYSKLYLKTIKTINKNKLNATSLGNAAFVYHHNPNNELIKNVYDTIITKFK